MVIPTADEFLDKRYKECNWRPDDLCPPSTDAQECMNLLYPIVFGEDAYETLPLRNCQVNTITMSKILAVYEGVKKSWFKRLIFDFLFGR